MNQEKKLLFTLAAVQFTNIMDFMIMMPLGPQLMRLFSINPQQFSFIASSYTITAGISGFISAFWVDKFDRKRVVQFCYAGFLLGTLFCGLSTDFYSMITARILTGMFGGILGSQVMAIVADVVPLERRGFAMGIVMTALSLASVFGVPFGLKLSDIYDYRLPFLFIVGIGIFIQLAVVKFIPPINKHLLNPKELNKFYSVIGLTFKDKNQLMALAMMNCLMFSQFSVIPFISPYMVKNVGFREDQLFLIYLVGGACTLFSMPLIGRMADKYGRLKIFSLGVTASIVPFLLITFMPPWPLWAALVVAGLFFVTMTGRGVPSSAIVSSAVSPQNRGSFMSFSSCIQQLSSGIGALIGGIIVSENESGRLINYWIVGLISVTVSVLAIAAARQIKVASGN